MKFFGWGRKRNPPPIQPTFHDEDKTSDIYAAITGNTRNPGTTRWGSRDTIDRKEERSTPLPRTANDQYFEALAGEMAESGVPWEDRLQETIRFVFSHEQEGLLAIGTFALDQIEGMRLDPDIKPSATTTTTTTTTTTADQSCRLKSSSVSSMQVVFRSSDDETEFHHSSSKKKELPVFGDHDALSDLLLRVLSDVEATKVLPILALKLNPACMMNAGANSRDQAHTEQYQLDEELYSPSVCGLFGSRSRARSRRAQKIGEKEKRKKLPPEKRIGNSEEQCTLLQAPMNLRKTVRATRFSSLGRLWRSGCNGPPPTHQVTPEPEMSPRESPQVAGVPCIANVELEGGTGAAAAPVLPKQLPSQPLEGSQKAGEGGERKRRHGFGTGTWACAQNGKWIRTDSEFVVLEM